MEISDELRNSALNEFSYYIDALEKQINIVRDGVTTITMPFFLDGVMDKIIYSVNEKRFTKLIISVATEGITGGALGKTAVYCDKMEIVTIDIPADLKPQKRPAYRPNPFAQT